MFQIHPRQPMRRRISPDLAAMPCCPRPQSMQFQNGHSRSGSSGTHSNASTLRGSESVFGPKSLRSESRFSEGTTLRGTPTPTLYEQEHRGRIEGEEFVRQEPTPSLHTLQETSPDRSTVRIVPPSAHSGSSDHPLRSEPSDSSILRPRTSPSNSEQRPTIPRRSSRRTSSASSTPAPLNIRKVDSSSTPRNQSSQESIAQSEATLPQSSSPNFVAYDSDHSRPRSRSQPLQATTSFESIQSRLQYPTTLQPETGRSLGTSSSWASLHPSSSTDTLPPLHIPKKRLRHKAASSSLQAAASSDRSMADEDIDTQPYPRPHWSSHLSTIASESDHQSRNTSQRLSHFSLGSGVLTIDDSSSIPLSGTWPRGRRESAPIDSIASDHSPVVLAMNSEEEAGDMTLGVFREESAKPQPLFQPRSGSAPGPSRKFDGQLPPMPPIPKSRDSDENFDRVSELQAPPLREKRSGYSLRRRSNSTPSRGHSKHLSQVSYSESDRGSHGSSLFPTWAKNFYGHGAALISASKISLSAPQTPRHEHGQQHARNDSQWTERSITSRLGTGYNEVEGGSPTSSHFLPSIFRPRARTRANTEGSKLRKSKRSGPSGDEFTRSDSLAISSDPLPQKPEGDVLPSGHPKYGSLKKGSDHRPLPRKYSKQKRWNEMEFPRPMTKDRLSDFGGPHLAPTKRNSHRMSAWRAPSFVESLDTLVRSRGNRQILLFALGFVCPLCWMLASVLPIPKKPISAGEFEMSLNGSEDDIQAAMMKHEAGDAEKRWGEEKRVVEG